MTSSFDDDGFNPTGDANRSRQQHLYDDLDADPGSHHHSLGQSPNQATSLPMAKAAFDARYATIAHTHQELAGDNLIINGDAITGDTNWSRTLVSAAAIIDAERFITQLNANPSSCIWKSEPFIPTVDEVTSGSITYQGNRTSAILEVSILHNLTGTIPDIADGVSTTEVVYTTTVDVIDTTDVAAFSWLVPNCVIARMFIKWTNGGITSGFPATMIHDNVQLITQLGTVSPLYVGVKDPQTMEGTLTITSETPLVLPTPAVGLGKVLTDTDGLGTVDWEDLPPSVKYIQDDEPTDQVIGDQWYNTTLPDYEDFWFSVTHGNVAPYNTATAPVTIDGLFHAVPSYPTIMVEVPCSGLLKLDWQAFLKCQTANDTMAWLVTVKTATNCSATIMSTYGVGQARHVGGTSQSEQNAIGGALWRITSVAAGGGVLELEFRVLLSTGATGTYRYPYLEGHFMPQDELRHTSLVMV